MAYYGTETLKPIPMGEYYDGGSGGAAIAGFGQDTVTDLETAIDEPTKRSFTGVHLVIALLGGYVIGKIL